MSDTNQRGQFEAFFEKATHHRPFCFQWEFARELPALVDVPTGLGKTAMVVIGWLWRRFGQAEELKKNTPRRLIYCLPMRVLVEQTRDCAVEWLYNLGLLAGTVKFDQHHDGKQRLLSYTPPSSFSDHDKIAAYILMGGEDEEEWDVYPERDAIIIGTQDMLLSRALNRGYAASRARWPMQFGLLHTDCLWVFDEIQLMGSGLATAAQLEAFRRLLGSRNGNGCRSVWMSATMRRDWLKTVDFKDGLEGLHQFKLSAEDHKNDGVKRRWNAKKPLVKAEATMGDAFPLADEIRRAHKSGTRTIIVVNTVRRARELFDAANASSDNITKTSKKRRERKDSFARKMAAEADALRPKVVLLHSRFRPKDRKEHVEEALANPSTEGTVVISTQVIEAGVDVSATTLFTELAPWASLVQRFGRCNRKGEDDGSQVFWIGLPTTEADAKGLAYPYELKTLQDSAEELKKLTDVGLQSLPPVNLFLENSHVIRRKDLIDLFDTTPDLAGNDIDIDRFVREIDGSDVHVFWRDYNGTPNGSDANEAESAPRHEELCSAPIGSDMSPGFRAFIKEHKGKVWRWTFLDKKWEPADANKIVPGQIFLVHPDAGGYSALRGWDQANQDRVEPINLREEAKGDTPDATEDERLSCIGVWQTITEHTEEVCRETDSILAALAVSDAETAALRAAARWHDWGKAHHVFQNAVDDGQIVARNGKRIPRRERPREYRGCRVVAKAPGKKWANGQFDAGFWRKYDWLPSEGRKQFRHELVSALAVLLPTVPIGEADRDLVAYLVAAHHGKVRLSIRSLPDEFRPHCEHRFARGVWDGDELPATELGGGIITPSVTLSLEPMELGLCENTPFAGQPSWAERMIRLRDMLGPFHLAYLEAILRAADMRASATAEREGARRQRRDVTQRVSLSGRVGKEA